LNTEYTNAQTERVRKEAAHDAMRSGTLEAAQVSSQGEELTKVGEKLRAAKEIFASVAATYGANHPEYRKAQSQVQELSRQLTDTKDNIARRIDTDYQESVAREKMLEQRIGDSKKEFDNVNSHLSAYQQLKREAENDRELYGELLRKVRESSINAGFQNRNIRITDYARPPFKPVSPNVPMNMALALLSSSFLALGGIMAVGATDRTLRNAQQTSRLLGVSVLGTLPTVKEWGLPGRAGVGNLMLEDGPRARRTESISVYAESVRKLRNAIVLSRDFVTVRSVVITSAMPGEGKSVTAVDFAVSYVRQQRRTLLIDADLRRPTLHKRFRIPNNIGLGDVLGAGAAWRSAVVEVPRVPRLSILPSGNTPAPPADIFGPAFQDLLANLHREYDLIVVDAPPMLPFAEPLQIASSVDAVVLVAHAGRTTADAAEAVLSALRWAGANVLGVVLNQVRTGNDGPIHYGQAYGDRPDGPTVFGSAFPGYPTLEKG
jgi:polysaccharide biosynthesis transport protein